MESYEKKRDDAAVTEIAEHFHGCDVAHFKQLEEGHHSTAFRYEAEGDTYILRLNDERAGFDKDALAQEFLHESDIPTSEVLEVGSLDAGQFYCISRALEGESIRDQYNRGEFTSFEKQFETIEKIADTPLNENQGDYGEWGTDEIGENVSFIDFANKYYPSEEVINWSKIKELPFYNESFMQDLYQKLNRLVEFSEGKRSLVHGDFGYHNLFMKNGEISGVIDWAKSFYGDKLYDVALIVLFCPNRELSSGAAIEYYKNERRYKERILAGVYRAMINNYAASALAGNQNSCEAYPNRIQEIEKYIALEDE